MDPAYQNATVLDEHFHDTNGCKFIFLETSLKETYIIALEKVRFMTDIVIFRILLRIFQRKDLFRQ